MVLLMRTFAARSGKAYYEAWSKALDTFLRWSDDEVWNWARRFEHRLNNPDDLLYNDTPMQYVAGLLIPDRLAACLSDDERRELRRDR